MGGFKVQRHSGIVDPSSDQLCRLCGEGDEELDHLWWVCPALQMQTASVVSVGIVGPNYPLNWILAQLGRFLHIPQIAKLNDPDSVK
jgi:hypothetical protein